MCREFSATVLGVMPAAVDEGAARLQMRGVAYGRRHRNPARLGHELDAGGDIDGVAEYGLRFVDDGLAKIHPDAEHQSPVLVERVVERASAWMPIAVATAAAAELNSAGMEAPTMFRSGRPRYRWLTARLCRY